MFGVDDRLVVSYSFQQHWRNDYGESGFCLVHQAGRSIVWTPIHLQFYEDFVIAASDAMKLPEL